jgi:hypothetical protein
MNRKTTIILIELLVYTLLFILALALFPVCNFYVLAKNKEVLTKAQYLFDFKIAYVFPLCQLFVLIGFFSLKKVIIFRMNYFILLVMFLSYVFINLGFKLWNASPVEPNFQAGYWLSQLFLLTTITRTSSFMKHLNEIQFHPKLLLAFSLLAKLIPIIMLISLFLTYYGTKK